MVAPVGGSRQVNEKRLVRLDRSIAIDRNRDRLGIDPASERQRTRSRSVVAARRGGAVRGGKVYGKGPCAAAAHNRERCVLGAGIAFRDRHIADRQRTARRCLVFFF